MELLERIYKRLIATKSPSGSSASSTDISLTHGGIFPKQKSPLHSQRLWCEQRAHTTKIVIQIAAW